MYDQPLESDWKIYRRRVDEWQDRYLARKNAKIIAILADEARTPTEQFWHAQEEMEREARRLDETLGRLARSQMMMNILNMYQRGMIDDADLAEFSEDLRERVLFIAKELGG